MTFTWDSKTDFKGLHYNDMYCIGDNTMKCPKSNTSCTQYKMTTPGEVHTLGFRFLPCMSLKP